MITRGNEKCHRIEMKFFLGFNGGFLYLCYLFVYATFRCHFMSITEQRRPCQKISNSRKKKETKPLLSSECAIIFGRQISGFYDSFSVDMLLFKIQLPKPLDSNFFLTDVNSLQYKMWGKKKQQSMTSFSQKSARRKSKGVNALLLCYNQIIT